MNKIHIREQNIEELEELEYAMERILQDIEIINNSTLKSRELMYYSLGFCNKLERRLTGIIHCLEASL